MATLRIEGGRRLSGASTVEGNKNSALPLMAACLLTDEECVIDQRAAHPRRRGAARAAARARRDGRGRGHVDAAHPVRRRSRPIGPIRCWSGSCAARCCCSGRCSRGGGRRGSRRRAAIFRRAAPSARTCRRWWRSGRSPRRRAGPCARRAGRPDRRVVLSRRGVGHRHRDRAARGGRRPGPDRDPPRGDGAARRRAVPVSAGDGRRRSRAKARRRFASTRRPGSPARRIGSTATTSRPAAGASSAAITGGDDRGHRRPRRRHGSRRRAASQDGPAVQLRRRSVRRRAVDADRGPPDHDRPVAGLSERHGQPGHRAGDAGRGPHARARLAVRAASVRARAAERDARRSVSVRSAPHHRQRPDEAARPACSTAATSDRGWR